MNTKLQRKLSRVHRLAQDFTFPMGPALTEENEELFAELGSRGTKDLREVQPLVVKSEFILSEGEEYLASPAFLSFVESLLDFNKSLIERITTIERAIHTLVKLEKSREGSLD